MTCFDPLDIEMFAQLITDSMVIWLASFAITFTSVSLLWPSVSHADSLYWGFAHRVSFPNVIEISFHYAFSTQSLFLLQGKHGLWWFSLTSGHKHLWGFVPRSERSKEANKKKQKRRGSWIRNLLAEKNNTSNLPEAWTQLLAAAEWASSKW